MMMVVMVMPVSPPEVVMMVVMVILSQLYISFRRRRALRFIDRLQYRDRVGNRLQQFGE